MNKYSQFKFNNAHVNVYYDNTEIDIDFENKEEEQSYLKKFESGDFLQVGVEVIVNDLSGHISGSDSLWAIHLDASKPLEPQVIETIKDHGMIEGAESDLQEKIKSILKSNGVK